MYYGVGFGGHAMSGPSYTADGWLQSSITLILRERWSLDSGMVRFVCPTCNEVSYFRLDHIDKGGRTWVLGTKCGHHGDSLIEFEYWNERHLPYVKRRE